MGWSVSTDGSLTGTRGDDLRILLEFYEDDNVTPLDLTGFTVRSQIRSKPNGYVILDLDVAYPSSNQVLLTKSSSATRLIRLTTGWWDVELEAPDGFITTELGPSPVTITRDITVEVMP